MIQVCRLKGACMFIFCSHLSLLCNPSPLLPRYHSSSPCKLSCSEPQRTLLSVELRILSFFNTLASMFLVFSKLCLSSISCLFFKPFPAFSYSFSRLSFLQFPTFPNGFINFPCFFQACHSFFPPVHMFLQFSSIFHLFWTIFLHFPLFFPTFFLPLSGDLGRIESHRHHIV